VAAIQNELEKYSENLADKPRWLVINKTDLLMDEDVATARSALVEFLNWDSPVFEVSAATGEGTVALAQAVMRALEDMKRVESETAA
jgi:GTP-binding protein